ncbi:MAG: hypothetical protein KF821_09105 [Anaerolineales bacterium]|nr:hypothetical protein [Anaerolineales bacterium]
MDGERISEVAAWELMLEATWDLEEEIYGEVCSPRPGAGVFRLEYVASAALAGVVCGQGEHIVQNKVYPGGVCNLRIVRLGHPVAAERYLEQLPAVTELQAWQWIDRRNGQEMHTLLLLWRL